MIILYTSDITQNFNTLGIGVLRDFRTNPQITEVLNGLFNLEFEYARDGWLSNNIIEGNIIKACGQLFRIRNIDKDIKSNNIVVLAKHIWFDNELNNWVEDVAPTNQTGHVALEWLLNRCKETNRFTISGDCTKTASARYVRMNPIDAIYTADNALLDKFGGEIEIDNFNITLHNKRGNNTGIEIRQEKNLTGATLKIDLATVATRLMPIGKDGIILPEKYVDSSLINNYYAPFYYKFDVDIGVDADKGITLNDCYTAMRAAAQELLDKGIDKPSVSISIDFIELSKTKEYANYALLESAHLGDTCKIYIPSLNISTSARIVKTVRNCIHDRIIKLELGTAKINYVSNNNSFKNEIKNTLDNMPTSILDKASQDATDLITHPFGGYIYISESTGELYIMNTNDVNTATKVWKLGLGGIGYSSNGINGPYTIAITQNGQIVADFITTGHLDTSVIQGYAELLLSVVTKDGVVAAINASEEAIKIIANRLELEGYTTINGAFSVDETGNAIIKGGNLDMPDTGQNSDPTIEIYDETAIANGTIRVGDKLSGKTLQFLWATSGSNKSNIGSAGIKDILTTDTGYSITGGYSEDHGMVDEYYWVYKNNTLVTTLYAADSMSGLLDDFTIDSNMTKSSYILPNDFGKVTSTNATDSVYSLIQTPNIRKKTTKFNSSGISIIDRVNDVDSSYSPHGMNIHDQYGDKYFNENGISYCTEYGSNYAEFDANKNLFAYFNRAGDTSMVFDCDNSNPSDDNFKIKINGSDKLVVNNNGVLYSALGAMSKEIYKKNIEKFDDGLSIIKKTDIYKYNLKTETEGCKKHIGFVIGDKYKYSRLITTTKNDGADIYSMISVAYRAIQQQDEQIQALIKQNTDLLNRIERLERKEQNEKSF